MKLSEIYDLAVEMGKKHDPRGADGVNRTLTKAAKEFNGLKDADKADYDQEQLKNPFADTRIIYGDPDTEVKSLIAGIDVETPELLLVDRLRDKGKDYDLALGHHPEGRAYAGLYKVMAIQSDQWHEFGVPVNVGDALLDDRMRQVMRGIMPMNKDRPVEAARLLEIPFMCCHTPADNMVTAELSKRVAKEAPQTLGDIMDILKTYPEYKQAAASGSGPTIINGSKDSRAGVIFVDMTGGTGGPEKAIEELVKAGVGTIVGMHMSEKNRDQAVKHHLNVVIAGHIASDSLGLNLFLDNVEARGVKIEAFSGFTRVARKPV
jgi:hypothetical protein